MKPVQTWSTTPEAKMDSLRCMNGSNFFMWMDCEGAEFLGVLRLRCGGWMLVLIKSGQRAKPGQATARQAPCQKSPHGSAPMPALRKARGDGYQTSTSASSTACQGPDILILILPIKSIARELLLPLCFNSLEQLLPLRTRALPLLHWSSCFRARRLYPRSVSA